MREGVVAGILLALGNEDGDGADSEHVELVLVGINGTLEVFNTGLTGQCTNLKNIDGTASSGISTNFGSHGIKNIWKLRHKFTRILDDREESITGNTIDARNVGKLELKAARETAINILHLKLRDAVRTVDAAGVDFHGGCADLLILIIQQVSQKVNTSRKCGALAELDKVRLGIHELGAQVGTTDIKGRNLRLAYLLFGGEDNFTIILSFQDRE
mmetsp:Transcript_13003/g.28232  ORF Transcript_13003/g.28232 Transcript_13003/m.28232 type:complete len:215 (+) Transcript_13003:2939-3583(+)